MFAIEKQTFGLYYTIKKYIKCLCGTPIWIEKPNKITGLTTMHCAVCQRFMTRAAFDQALHDYSCTFNEDQKGVVNL